MNIDKDIEKLKWFLSKFSDYMVSTRLSTKNLNEIEKAIENVLAEFEELKEDNYAYHQLMRMQNAREYRSKFLKDFKKEYGENVMPDYDEIYKRYDKQKKEIETKDKAIETWKKIAEFLADKGNFDHYSYCESNIFSCNAKTPKKTCKQCILEWARKEVDKQ